MDEFDKALIEAQEQKGDVWRDTRCGRFTSSEIHKLLTDPRSKVAKDRGDWSDGALTYIHTKVAEQITGFINEPPRTSAITWGEDHEPFARDAYSNKIGINIEEAGFVVYGDHAGGSPDGLQETNRFLEIKCPFNSSNHIDYLMIKKPSDLKDLHWDYWVQIQSNMIFTGRTIATFISYDPRFKSINQDLRYFDIDQDNETQDLIKIRLDKAIKTKLEIVKLLS